MGKELLINEKIKKKVSLLSKESHEKQREANRLNSYIDNALRWHICPKCGEGIEVKAPITVFGGYKCICKHCGFKAKKRVSGGYNITDYGK